MVNRIRQWMEEGDVPTDYWIVSSDVGNIPVTAEVARQVTEALGTTDSCRWVDFEDLFGSNCRIRRSRIDAIWECTAGQRRKRQRFYEERRRESDSDRSPWEEE